MSNLINHIIGQLMEIQKGNLWMGDTFKDKFSQIDEEHLFTSPIEGLHSVAQIISHLTFWRQEAILKIETGKGSKTEDCEENWLSNEKLKEFGWAKIKDDYDHSLKKLIDLLQNREDRFLEQSYYDTDFKGEYPYSFLINGMLHHDLYHLGQLGIIIKFLKKEIN